MTKDKLPALARRTPNKNGFNVVMRKAFRRKRGQGTVEVHEVILEPDVGFPAQYPVLLTTASLSTASESRDRFFCWLAEAGLSRSGQEGRRYAKW